MTENENKSENKTEYTFINRNTGRRSSERFAGEIRPSARTEEPSREEFSAGEDGFSGREEPFAGTSRQSGGRQLKGIGFVLAAQTVLALLLVLAALGVRLIGGQTAQKAAAWYHQLTESGSVDLKSLFTPLELDSSGASQAESAASAVSGLQSGASSAVPQSDAEQASSAPQSSGEASVQPSASGG